MRNTGEGAKPSLRYSLNLSAHFPVWVTVWVRQLTHILTHTISGVFATKKHRKPKFSMLFGAAGQIRTADLILTNCRRAFQPLLYKALRRFFVQKGRDRSLFVPLFPSMCFPVWVTVWVKALSGRERGAHLRQRQAEPHQMPVWFCSYPYKTSSRRESSKIAYRRFCQKRSSKLKLSHSYFLFQKRTAVIKEYADTLAF